MKNDINDNNINNLCDNYHFQINGKIFFFNNYRKKNSNIVILIILLFLKKEKILI